MGKLNEKTIANMKYIVDNCMGESEPACIAACPMGTHAKKYAGLLGEGNGEEALKVIREKVFFPGVLGRICAHPCETACRRNESDEGISIAYLKRYAADNFDKEELWDISKKDLNGKKVAIIGAGPAGAQSAHDLLKLGYSVTIFEKLNVLGGMMRVGIPEYRLPRNIIDREYSILNMLGVDLKLGIEVGKDISFEDIKNEYDAVIVAVGRQIGRKDEKLDNIDAEGIYSAAEFLKETSLTRGHSGVGKRVAVIGGGDVAMDCARTSIRIKGVEEVVAITLENSKGKLPASKHELHSAKGEDVEFKLGYGIKKIIKDSKGRVSGLELKKCLSVFNKKGEFEPKYDLENIEKIEVDTLIFAIGQGVDGSFDKNKILGKNPNGTFAVDPLTMQSVTDEKVFIAGDCASAYIAVEALAEGRKAAKSIDRFLNARDLKEGRDFESEGSYVSKLYIPNEYLGEGWDAVEKTKKIKNSKISKKERKTTFNEVEKAFTHEEVQKEGQRCLQCQCKMCMQECIMLNDYTDCPKKLFGEYLEKGYENIDPKVAYSCNMCDQCTLKCPKEFDIKGNFAEMRVEYVKDNNGKSPMKGHKAIDIHQGLSFSKLFNTTNKAPQPKKTKYVFYPGCALPSYRPDAVGKIMEHLQDRLDGEVGSILKCCGKPLKALGQNELLAEKWIEIKNELDKVEAEVVIVACQSCYGMMNAYSGKKAVSLWELLPEIGLPDSQVGIGKDSDVVFNIQDSCSIRDKTKIHNGIRWIVNELGYKVEELENSKEKTRCCGFGGMIVPVVPDIARRVWERRAAESTTGHMISYCAACRESMEKGGADSLHIVDLIFGEKYSSEDKKPRNVGVVKQWINRYKAKMILKKNNK